MNVIALMPPLSFIKRLGQLFPSGYQANEQSELIHHTPTHTTCHALHFNTVQLD